MLHAKEKQHRLFIFAAISWLFLDLVTKYYAFYFLAKSKPIIDGWFYLSTHYNKGIAFGIFFGRWLQIIASVTVLSLLIYYGWTNLMKKNPVLHPILLGIVSGGAIGNLANRLYSGYVVDFIVLKPLPVFNIADIGISVGLALLAIMEFTNRES